MVFSSGHALVIGVGSYLNTPQLNVPLTATDAGQVAAVLKEPSYCGYPEGQVVLLTEAAASRDRILAELDRLATTTTEADTVVMFYSGHGEYGADGYYLTTFETRVENGKVVGNSGVREAELLDRLRKLPAARALLLFNACHAGEISPGSLGGIAEVQAIGQAVPDDLATALLGTGEGRVIVTACRETQKSYFGGTTPQHYSGRHSSTACGGAISARGGATSAFLICTITSTAQCARQPDIAGNASRSPS